MHTELQNIQQLAADISKHWKAEYKPSIAVVLGSGLGDFISELKVLSSVSYSELPLMKQSTVQGHAGNFVLAEVDGKQVLFMQGRVHMYEGHSPIEVVRGLRAMITLGAKNIVLTNAAGGIHGSFDPGTLMLISDHLNLTAVNCLSGDNFIGDRFPDMSDAYATSLRELAKGAAKEVNVDLKEGVYAGLLGPSYETPAEIRMLRTMGADAVGMSTVQETIAAVHMGAKVCGISCITNKAAGMSGQALNHDEVKEVAELSKHAFSSLLLSIIKRMEKA